MALPNSIAEYLESIPDARSRYAIRRVLDAVYANVATGLIATGTNLATAVVLRAQTNIFATVPVGAGASLDPAFIMGTCRVVNASLNDILIYPPVTAQIGSGSAGDPVTVPAGAAADFATNSPTALWTAS